MDLISDVMSKSNYLKDEIDLKYEGTFPAKELLTTGTVCYKK